MGDANRSSLGALRDAVFDCIFDHGLQNQAWDLGQFKFVRNIDVDLKAVSKSHLLYIQILLCKCHLFLQRHLLASGVIQHPAQEITQFCDHADGGVIPSLTHEAGNGVERIEQEMRLNLLSQGVQLSLNELLIESRGFSLPKGKARSGVHDIVQQKNATIQNHIGEQPVAELVEPESQVR